ncbi:hypothetical protein C4M98_00740 [Mycoplasmopsis pullorum]|uniref:hypothetical protein n=1 Tax=Mycoplasmopsis pullorum TaxID=48003 RepID=UPI00111BC7BD|nr:hypothetical protein [Mycoplasmopsis pullorum]TNK81929.1 hypothetical protein C4M94_02540 [Mycoplasmopsis pullorum]TNK84651.1 hypothetical protein C4M81_01650 [Mycoplasmopsis pullorum]TNK85389.1 hypothetical protein C4M92_01530 [Mycoplasmopsis pullorum]TNK85974.1 hypothetical protein C4M85_01785 [Mycoplasmopsis pullorum]TNK86255.1 hypothetical protein C4M87_03780 [Mycoplasmopsis pullorum]
MIDVSKFLKVKTITELWTHEKKSFRIWIVSYALILFLLFGMILGSLLWFKLDQSAYLTQLKSFYESNKASSDAAVIAANEVFQTILTRYAVSAIFAFCIFVYFLATVVRSYALKSFSRLTSMFSLLIFYLGWIFISEVLFAKNYFQTLPNSHYLYYSACLIGVISYFLVGKSVTKIKQLFMEVTFRMQRDQMLEELRKRGGIFGDNFNPFTGTYWGEKPETNQESNSESNQAAQQNQNENPEVKAAKAANDEKKKTIDKLLSLPNATLHSMARRLNIFGYENLSKEELAEKIYEFTKKTDVSNQNNEEDAEIVK